MPETTNASNALKQRAEGGESQDYCDSLYFPILVVDFSRQGINIRAEKSF